MSTRLTAPSTDADLPPLEYDCHACGVNSPAALVACPYGAGPPLALCAVCVRDRAQLHALIRALTSCPALLATTPRADHAA